MPSSEIIPREQLSAWERWELSSLGAVPNKVESDRLAAEALATERAHVFAEARAAGYAQGRAEAASEQTRLASLARSLAHCASEHEQLLVDEVLDLAIVLAQQMVGKALAVKREYLLPVVSAALRQLPQNTQYINIVVNPADRALVQDHLGAEPFGERCHLVGNPAITAGGCRIETEQCDMDATVQGRWKRVAGSLGRTGEWIDGD
ncbi:MAG: FliH/SctL family protein [Pseudomonadota bacterium]|nr:FliH/SctL family protein [Pseudomonadota bacterium]